VQLWFVEALLLRRILIALGVIVGVFVVAAIAFAGYVTVTWDKVYDAPLPNVHASTHPEVIARGEYLVYGPARCASCHAPSFNEYLRLADGVKPPLAGGERFELGPLGVVYPKNLTPDPETGIGRYSDAQIARLLRSAVRPDGRATLGPLMPFDRLSETDVTAIISFLRAQPPVRHSIPDNEWSVFGKILRTVHPAFKPRLGLHPPADAPPSAPTHERGEYLARAVSGCADCHTNRLPPTFAIVSPEFSGGLEMEAVRSSPDAPGTSYRTPNITPAEGSALSKFADRDTFIARFQHGGRKYAGSPMPWESFSRMTTEDLGALYEFLHSLAPQPGPTGEPMFRKAN
jgi:mono/diheme cytochrome c family protein